MSNSLYYLLTFLPSLPDSPGMPLAVENAIEKLREESAGSLQLLCDLLEVEQIIEKCAINYYLQGIHDYQPELSERLPESFKEVLLSFRQLNEPRWTGKVYAAWLELLIAIGNRTGAKLLKDWAGWEYALRTQLLIGRLRAANRTAAEIDNLTEELSTDLTNLPDQTHLVEAAMNIGDPMQAEKMLDQARIDFVRQAGTPYSFSVDELVAYMLELRIHQRHAGLNPEKGRELLKEVTRL